MQGLENIAVASSKVNVTIKIFYMQQRIAVSRSPCRQPKPSPTPLTCNHKLFTPTDKLLRPTIPNHLFEFEFRI